MTAPPLPRPDVLRASPAAEAEALRREYEDLRTRLAEIARRLDRLAAACREMEDEMETPSGVVSPCPAATEEGPSLPDLIDALVRDVDPGRPAGTCSRRGRPRGPGPRRWRRLAGAAWVVAALSLLGLALLAVRLAF